MNNEVKDLAKLIMETNGGRASFNFSEAKDIIPCGINEVPVLCNKHGILVSPRGRAKYIAVTDIARMIIHRRVAPVNSG